MLLVNGTNIKQPVLFFSPLSFFPWQTAEVIIGCDHVTKNRGRAGEEEKITPSANDDFAARCFFSPEKKKKMPKHIST